MFNYSHKKSGQAGKPTIGPPPGAQSPEVSSFVPPITSKPVDLPKNLFTDLNLIPQKPLKFDSINPEVPKSILGIRENYANEINRRLQSLRKLHEQLSAQDAKPNQNPNLTNIQPSKAFQKPLDEILLDTEQQLEEWRTHLNFFLTAAAATPHFRPYLLSSYYPSLFILSTPLALDHSIGLATPENINYFKILATKATISHMLYTNPIIINLRLNSNGQLSPQLHQELSKIANELEKLIFTEVDLSNNDNIKNFLAQTDNLMNSLTQFINNNKDTNWLINSLNMDRAFNLTISSLLELLELDPESGKNPRTKQLGLAISTRLMNLFLTSCSS